MHFSPVLFNNLINATKKHITSFLQQILTEHITLCQTPRRQNLANQCMRLSWKEKGLILIVGEWWGQLKTSAYLINRARTKYIGKSN